MLELKEKDMLFYPPQLSMPRTSTSTTQTPDNPQFRSSIGWHSPPIIAHRACPVNSRPLGHIMLVFAKGFDGLAVRDALLQTRLARGEATRSVATGRMVSLPLPEAEGGAELVAVCVLRDAFVAAPRVAGEIVEAVAHRGVPQGVSGPCGDGGGARVGAAGVFAIG